MTFRKLLKTCDSSGESQQQQQLPQQQQSQSAEKVYGYVDAFQKMGDLRPTQMYTVKHKKITIGRDHSCQIRIKNTRVSRFQCSILVSDDVNNVQITLQNLTARATTVHNNKMVGLCDQVVLQHGDRFRIFDVEFRWRKYDPVDEQGRLDWSRPLPVIRLAPPPTTTPTSVPQLQQQQQQQQQQPRVVPKKPEQGQVTPPQRRQLAVPSPILKMSNRALPEPRRKSCPPSMTSAILQFQQKQQQQKQNSNRLKIPGWSSMKLLSSPTPNSVENKNRINKQQQQQKQPSMNNNKNVSTPIIGDKRRSSVGGQVSAKRRGSADYDMRKAVLQRSFRRAFKDKVQLLGGETKGSLIDVEIDSRFRRALEDLIVLSSAA